MSDINGAITISGVPPHWGLTLSLCFFPVSGPEEPPPYGGNPPADAGECAVVQDSVDHKTESTAAYLRQSFRLEKAPGHYYLQVRALLFRKNGDELFAQAEQFFFGRRALEVTGQVEVMPW
jgi:hypothetical protein